MSKAYIDEKGVARWKSNNRVVPADAITPEIVEMPGFNFKSTWNTREAETKAFLDSYRKEMANHVPSAEEMCEMQAAFGPGAEVVNVVTGQKYQTPGQKPFGPETFSAAGGTENPYSWKAARQQKATSTLNQIDPGTTVTFPYNGQTFTATVEKINKTTATVTITKVEGRSNTPRQRPILPGTKGVRVSASILARSM